MEKTMTVVHYTHAISELNDAINLKLAPAEIQSRIEIAQQALKVENDSRIDTRVSALLSLFQQSPAEFWTEYLNNSTVEVLRLMEETNDDGILYAAKPAQKYLSFGRLETAWRKLDDNNVTLARVPSVYRMIAYFVNNLDKHIAGDLSPEEDAAKRKVTVPVFNYNQKKGVTPNDRKTLDFSKCTMQALADQLDAIALNLLPEGFCPHLRKSDLRAIKQFHTNNSLRKAQLNNEARFVENLLEIIRLRVNDELVKVSSNASVYRVKTEDSASQH